MFVLLFENYDSPSDVAVSTNPAARRQLELLNLIQIGANDGIKGNNKQVMRILNHADSRAILVEGSPSVFPLLTHNIQTKFDPSLTRIVPFQALVCEEGETKTFYILDASRFKAAINATNTNFALPHWVEYQLASLDKESIQNGVAFYIKTVLKKQHSIQAEDFIIEESLKCVSFSTILTQSSMRPEEVNVLAVDVEGYDAHVILESFKMPHLEPDIIIFEHKSAMNLFPTEFNEVMKVLEQRGYQTNCNQSKSSGGNPSWVCSDKQDVWARKGLALSEDATGH